MNRSWSVALVLAACGGGGPAPITPREFPESPAGIDRAVIERELQTLLAIADRACACTDATCAEEVDADHAAFVGITIMNDPITDLETWPSDLDALGYAANSRFFACLLDHGRAPTAIGVAVIRRIEALRDAACACTDAVCARRVQTPAEEALTEFDTRPAQLRRQVGAKAVVAAKELRACLDDTIAEQAMLELRAIRTTACACQDTACADVQEAALSAWATEYEHAPPTPEHSIDDLSDVARELRTCLLRARE